MFIENVGNQKLGDPQKCVRDPQMGPGRLFGNQWYAVLDITALHSWSLLVKSCHCVSTDLNT